VSEGVLDNGYRVYAPRLLCGVLVNIHCQEAMGDMLLCALRPSIGSIPALLAADALILLAETIAATRAGYSGFLLLDPLRPSPDDLRISCARFVGFVEFEDGVMHATATWSRPGVEHYHQRL
jgi:hypothetical protein